MGSLPNNLDELKDPIAGFNIPLDPDSLVPYGYEKISDLSTGQASLSFQTLAPTSVCLATNRVIQKEYQDQCQYFMGESSLNENWRHEKGAVCFDRKIDKDLYPILKGGKI